MAYISERLDFSAGPRRKMVITRVRNHSVASQYIDVAMTVSLYITRRQENNNNSNVKSTFQQYSNEFAALQLVNPADTSPVFEVTSRSDLIQAYKNFRQQMGDDS